MTATRIGFVGLGIISETHLAVLADLPNADLVFTVDPDTGPTEFRGAAPAHYPSLKDALADQTVDLIVVATPTSTHSELATDALTLSTARVLVEKPLVHDLPSLERLGALAPDVDLDGRLMVAHHFAFAPEVLWAADLISRNPAWGPVSAVTCAFYDPYILRGAEAFASYGSSWTDSGINQLSMLTRFVDLDTLTSRQEADSGASAWCTASYMSRDTVGMARLHTSWRTGASSKHTKLTLADDGIEIWLDHTAMIGFAARGDELLAELANDGQTPRKIAHYRPLYETILAGTPDPAIACSTAVKVTRLLHSPPSAHRPDKPA